MPSPIRVWPVLQEYVATELYVVVGADTVPFTGLLSVPQSTAAATRKIRTKQCISTCTERNSISAQLWPVLPNGQSHIVSVAHRRTGVFAHVFQ